MVVMNEVVDICATFRAAQHSKGTPTDLLTRLAGDFVLPSFRSGARLGALNDVTSIPN